MSRLRTFFSLLAAALLLLTAAPSFAQDPPADEADAEVAADDEAEAGADDAEAGSDDATADGEATADEGAADDGAAAAEDELTDEDIEDETPSPWSMGLILSVSALTVGGGSAILGIWVDRDQTRPVSFAYSMSFLIACAVLVGVSQSYLDAVDAIQKEQDLERMLDMTYEIAVASGDPELIALVEKEAGVAVEAMPEAEAGDTATDTGMAPEADGSDEDVLAGDAEDEASTDDGSAD